MGEHFADLLVNAVDKLRAEGNEALAVQLETFAPLVGAFVGMNETRERRGRAAFIADLAAHMLVGELEVALDSGEKIAPKVRRACELAALIVDEAERVAAKRGP